MRAWILGALDRALNALAPRTVVVHRLDIYINGTREPDEVAKAVRENLELVIRKLEN